MNRFCLPVIAAGLAAGAPASAAPADNVLEPYSASYEVSRGLLRGETEVTLARRDDGTWSYHSRLVTKGLISLLRTIEINEHTDFRIEDGRLVPLRHRYTIEGAGSRDRDFDIAFDWVERRAGGIVRGETVDTALEPGIVDRHAMTLALSLDTASGREYPRHYVILDRGRIRHFDAHTDGTVSMRTEAGEFETLHVVQQRTDDPGRRFLTWLAPSLGYIPVRIKSVDDDGRDVTMTLTGIRRP